MLDAQEELASGQQRPAHRDIPWSARKGHWLLVESLQGEPLAAQAERFHVDPVEQVFAGVHFELLAHIERFVAEAVGNRDAHAVLWATQRDDQLPAAFVHSGRRGARLEVGRGKAQGIVVQRKNEAA